MAFDIKLPKGVMPLPPLPPPPPVRTLLGVSLEEAMHDEEMKAPVKRGRPRTTNSILPALAPSPINNDTNRTKAETARQINHAKIDDTLSETHWTKVYESYAISGKAQDIAQMTGLAVSQINHLLNYGVTRLSLPPIREHATDFETVSLRTESITRAVKKDDETFLRNLPDLRKAVTDRASREAAAAQGLLYASMQSVDNYLGYVNDMMAKLKDGSSQYDVPQAITPQHLDIIAKTGNNLAKALDTAVRLSRFTAGEPDQNISIQVAGFVCQMSADELRQYLKTKAIPTHVLQPQGASAQALNDGPRTEASVGASKIIDVKPDR